MAGGRGRPSGSLQDTVGLLSWARVAIQQKPFLTIRPRNPVGDDSVDQFIAYQAATRQDGTSGLAQLRTGFALGAEHLPGRDCGDLESLRQIDSLRTLTKTKSEEQQ